MLGAAALFVLFTLGSRSARLGALVGLRLLGELLIVLLFLQPTTLNTKLQMNQLYSQMAVYLIKRLILQSLCQMAVQHIILGIKQTQPLIHRPNLNIQIQY